MDKRYQVFVSSTYEDLKVERQEIMQALLELDCIPAGMELFPAADYDQWTLIKKVIYDCDYYIVIVGGRYGSTDENGISYTQKEYEYAISIGKPVIGFLHKNPGKLSADMTENSDDGKKKLNDFRKLVGTKMCKHWESPAELGSVVSRSLVQLIKNRPTVGWIRADQIGEQHATEILQLRWQIDALKIQLETERTNGPMNTGNLAQGSDKVGIKYKYSARKPGVPGYGESPYSEEQSMTYSTWNKVFYRLGPLMQIESNESNLIHEFREFIREIVIQKLLIKYKDISAIDANFQDFITVILQFKSLGLITKSQIEHKDSERYWFLTPFGENELSKLRAVKRMTSKRSIN